MNASEDDDVGEAGGADPDDGHLAPDEWGDPVPDVVEPGRPDPENVAFVLLGVLAAVYVIARVAGLV